MSELMNALRESFAVFCGRDFCEVFQLVTLCTSTSGHNWLNVKLKISYHKSSIRLNAPSICFVT